MTEKTTTKMTNSEAKEFMICITSLMRKKPAWCRTIGCHDPSDVTQKVMLMLVEAYSRGYCWDPAKSSRKTYVYLILYRQLQKLWTIEKRENRADRKPAERGSQYDTGRTTRVYDDFDEGGNPHTPVFQLQVEENNYLDAIDIDHFCSTLSEGEQEILIDHLCKGDYMKNMRNKGIRKELKATLAAWDDERG